MGADDSHERFLETLEAVQALLDLVTKREQEINLLYERIEMLEGKQAKRNDDFATLGWNEDLALKELGNGAEGTPADDELQQGGILIIESLMPMQLKIREMLAGGGFPILGEVGSIGEAMKFMESQKPDMVILGSLPREDAGFDALKDMRDLNPELKVIIITDVDQLKGLIVALQYKDVEVLSKPINRLRLLEMADSLLNQPSACPET